MFSLVSVNSLFSVLSVNSLSSLLSLNSAYSVLSINSAFSVSPLSSQNTLTVLFPELTRYLSLSHTHTQVFSSSSLFAINCRGENGGASYKICA